MKKIILLCVIISLIAAAGCDDARPAGTIKVTANYLIPGSIAGYDTGFGCVDATNPGSGGFKVIVWDISSTVTDGRSTADYTGNIGSDGGSVSIKVATGDYYVLVLYDFKTSTTGDASEGEYYTFYSNALVAGVAQKTAASVVTVTKGAISPVSLDLEDSYVLLQNQAFDVK